ncbi:RHS repeat-associated core domain-containing protein [Heyndrickxia oleronia]|jgi:RHS repeat-associated protein|nr:RHS repeat-associated core domain-containing protein [Heyndrickxia oleronia]
MMTLGTMGNFLIQSGDLASENPYRYAGYRYDENTSLYYLMARYYSAETCVFLSQDPILGDLNNPITLNGYSYSNNNPVMLIDPNGTNAQFKYALRKGWIGWLQQYVGWQNAGALYSLIVGRIAGVYTLGDMIHKFTKKRLEINYMVQYSGKYVKTIISQAKNQLLKTFAKKAAAMIGGGILGLVPDIYTFSWYFVKGWMEYGRKHKK